MTPDLFDISHHNTITDWGAVPLLPIVHKVNEGTKIDSQFAARMPTISQRTEIFGGYTVLIVSSSSIRKQIETYAGRMEPFWRDGAFTQLDVEPWDAYDRPVDVDEIEEAQAVHDELLGPGRCTVYINPNQMPATFEEWWASNRDRPLWLPNYSADGEAQAGIHGATLHQYTSKYAAPGFTAGIDANVVRDWDVLREVCHLTDPEPIPEPEDEEMMILINDIRLQAVFSLEGVPISPEVLDAIEAAGVPFLLVDQDHDYWRAAMAERVGSLAGFLYGRRFAEMNPDG